MNRRSVNRWILGARLVALIALYPCNGHADAWTGEPSLSLGAEASSNPLGVPGGGSGTAAVATSSLPMDWSEGIHHFTLRPTLRLGASGGESGLGTDGYYLSGNYRAEAARWTLTSDMDLSDDSSLIRQPDAGTLVKLPIRQYGANVKASASYELSERDSVAATLNQRHQRYGAQTAVALYDFNFDSAGAQYTHLLTQEHAVMLSVDSIRYRLPRLSYGTDSVNVSAGLTGVFAEQWQYRVNWGQSKLSTAANPRRATGTLYAVQLDRAGERTRASFSLTQSLQPSGFGTLVLSREATARVDWAASERLKLSLTARRANTSDAFFSLSLATRRFDAITASADWTLSGRWTSHFDLNYSNSTTGGLFTQAATAHAVGGSVGLIRRFSRLSLT